MSAEERLDEDISEQLEEILVKADIGVKTTFQLLESVTERMKRRELDDPRAVVAHLKSLITGILVGVEEPLRIRAWGQTICCDDGWSKWLGKNDYYGQDGGSAEEQGARACYWPLLILSGLQLWNS